MKLVQRIQGDVDKLSAQNGGKPVPIDLVTTSGSGLDPDVTPDSALFQAPRVAKARGISEDRVRQLIQSHIAGRQLGVLGESRVNVLALNLDLDKNALKSASPRPKAVMRNQTLSLLCYRAGVAFHRNSKAGILHCPPLQT